MEVTEGVQNGDYATIHVCTCSQGGVGELTRLRKTTYTCLPQGGHSEWYRQCRTGTGKHFHP